MFYNSKRRHGSSDQMSPTEYENQYYQRLEVSKLSVAIQFHGKPSPLPTADGIYVPTWSRWFLRNHNREENQTRITGMDNQIPHSG